MKKDLWSSIGFFIFALITIHESLKLPIWKKGTPMSGLFPIVLGILLAFVSILLFLRAVSKKTKEREGPESVLEASKVDWRKVFLSMAAIAVYPFLFQMMGYIISTVIFIFFTCKFVGRVKILAALAITLATIVVSYCIFGYLLGVPLP